MGVSSDKTSKVSCINFPELAPFWGLFLTELIKFRL